MVDDFGVDASSDPLRHGQARDLRVLERDSPEGDEGQCRGSLAFMEDGHDANKWDRDQELQGLADTLERAGECAREPPDAMRHGAVVDLEEGQQGNVGVSIDRCLPTSSEGKSLKSRRYGG